MKRQYVCLGPCGCTPLGCCAVTRRPSASPDLSQIFPAQGRLTAVPANTGVVNAGSACSTSRLARTLMLELVRLGSCVSIPKMSASSYCLHHYLTQDSENAAGYKRSIHCWASQNTGAELSLTASTNGARTCTYDVVSLGNLCVDVVLHLDKVSRC